MKNYKNPPPTAPFLMSKKEKNSNFAVFKIANNFIAGIQFLAYRLTTKKLGTPKAPLNTPKLPLFIAKIRKNSNFAVYEIANNFIAGIQFLVHRLATKKIGNPQSTAEHPQNYPYLLQKYKIL